MRLGARADALVDHDQLVRLDGRPSVRTRSFIELATILSTVARW